jgi:hypothetical protein
MKKILNFKNFLNEKYVEDPEYRIRKFFEELEKNIKFWFDEGSFSVEGTELYNIDIETTNNIEKYLKFDFIDSNFYYQVIFIVTLQEVEEEVLDECHIKLKRYDIETSQLLREVSEDVAIKDISEDTLIELFAKMDEVSDSILGEEEDEGTLSDDDTELEDTDIA